MLCGSPWLPGSMPSCRAFPVQPSFLLQPALATSLILACELLVTGLQSQPRAVPRCCGVSLRFPWAHVSPCPSGTRHVPHV